MIQHLYILQNDHHDKSSEHPSPYIDAKKCQIGNTALLTIVTRLYITSPAHIYFLIGSLYLSATFTHFPNITAPPPTYV